MKIKEKLQGMTPKQKREYIWEYYWVHILSVAAVIIVGAYFLVSHFTYQDPLLEFVMINTYKSGEEQEQVITQFLEQKGIQVFDHAVTVNANIRFGVDESSDAVSVNQLMIVTTAGEGDCYFWTGEQFTPYINRGALADLREFFSADYLKDHEAQLVYAEIEGYEPYPCGFDLKGNPWAKDHGYLNGGWVGIGRNVKNKELTVDFITYILEQK